MVYINKGVNRKGQTFTSDFFVSAIIFMFILNISYITWNSAQDVTAEFESDNMQKKIFYITDMLTRTPGYPYGWNSTDVELIGLSDSSNMINSSKLDELQNMSYYNMTFLWGITDYEFNLTVSGDYTYKTFGKDIDHDARHITHIERVVLIDYGNGAIDKGYLKYTLWKM
ncbi:MAG: hypothetical protein GQ477_06105 [Nanohaloarchaea archaeon]|nr:hypothetical protein [Candidatus Nanohaloarchaea archaeon]